MRIGIIYSHRLFLNLDNVFYGCAYYIDGVAPQPTEHEGLEPSQPFGPRTLAGFPLHHLSNAPNRPVILCNETTCLVHDKLYEYIGNKS